MLDFIFKRNKKIKSFMITKTGRIETKIQYPNDNVFNYNDGAYIVNKQARLLCSGINAWVHIEGMPDPLNFAAVKKPDDLKIDSVGLKSVLKAKLFYELFNTSSENIKDMIMFILIGLLFVGMVIMAIQMKDYKKLLEQIAASAASSISGGV